MSAIDSCVTGNEVDKIQPPYLKGFVIVLPDSVPLPDQAIWSFETDELEPLLDGQVFAPTVSSNGPIPSDGVGRNFVSLRFWQVEDTNKVSFETDLDNLFAAFDRVHPGQMLETEARTSTEEAGLPPRYKTAVEAVTFVAKPEDLVATAVKPDPLSRCLDKLFEWHRAYRAIAQTPVDELTYPQLFPLVLTFRRSLDDDVVTPDGLMHLESNNVQMGALATHIGSIDQNLLAVSLSRLQLGDPVQAFLERQVDAQYERRIKGDYASSVIQFSIACEIILDGLLGLLLWEEGCTEEDAATIFSADITPRLKSQYASRLGGNWQLDTGGLSGWFDYVASPRNRVVHAGRRLSAQEAFQASDAVMGLTKFLSDRLAHRLIKYPKTAWLFLGPDGLRERSRLTRRMQDWIESQPPNAVLDWIRDYAEWRERVNGKVQRRRRTT